MPKADNTPDNVKPYKAHGLDLSWDSKQAVCDCPFCGKESKFSVELETSKFKCWSCGESGNSVVFLRKLWKMSDESTGNYDGLMQERGLMFPDTLMQWGVCRSAITHRWLVPGYNTSGDLTQLYRWTQTDKGMRLIPTPNVGGHALHGVNLFDSKKPIVCICEGPWDAMALWETMVRAKETEEGLRTTANASKSLISEVNVLAVPGINVFNDSWLKLLSDCSVTIMFDNDYPKPHPKTGKTKDPASFTAIKKLATKMNGSKYKPREVNYIRWGKETHNPDLPSGYDVKDALNAPSKA